MERDRDGRRDSEKSQREKCDVGEREVERCDWRKKAKRKRERHTHAHTLTHTHRRQREEREKHKIIRPTYLENDINVKCV